MEDCNSRNQKHGAMGREDLVWEEWRWSNKNAPCVHMLSVRSVLCKDKLGFLLNLTPTSGHMEEILAFRQEMASQICHRSSIIQNKMPSNILYHFPPSFAKITPVSP